MKYIVITLPYFWEGEAEAITHMLEQGLERLHIRKPGSTPAQREALLRAIPERYHDRIVIGEKLWGEDGHACHSIEELREWKGKKPYLSLSPIYDSVSKVGYKSGFTHEQLIAARDEGLIDEHVLALGGITRENIERTMAYGFGGVMVLGDAWKDFVHGEATL